MPPKEYVKPLEIFLGRDRIYAGLSLASGALSLVLDHISSSVSMNAAAFGAIVHGIFFAEIL